jgi:peptide-methionine (S)-S-oxide reductase
VLGTLVGYSGGAENAPTYRSMGGHTEAVLVAFDPGEVSVKILVNIFWDSHYPLQNISYRQYRNVVFYNGKEQQAVIESSRDEVQIRLGGEVGTAVEAATAFYPAEDYHQKYLLRKKRALYSTLRATYTGEADFVAATVSARLNGYLDGKGSMAEVEKELNRSSIPAKNREAMLQSLR